MRYMAAVKTAGTMFRTVRKIAHQLYLGEIGYADFLEYMADEIRAQLTRAWREALRELGLDPGLVTTEFADDLYNDIVRQFDHLDGYARDILRAAQERTPFAPLSARAQMWANRYNDSKHAALIAITTAYGGKLEWRLGPTEEHCATCSRLNGLVAFGREWDTAGVRPQGGPNPALECGGWNCQCELVPTDRRRSPDALGTLLDVTVERKP
jgi:hypothetical protein